MDDGITVVTAVVPW